MRKQLPPSPLTGMPTEALKTVWTELLYPSCHQGKDPKNWKELIKALSCSWANKLSLELSLSLISWFMKILWDYEEIKDIIRISFYYLSLSVFDYVLVGLLIFWLLSFKIYLYILSVLYILSDVVWKHFLLVCGWSWQCLLQNRKNYF